MFKALVKKQVLEVYKGFYTDRKTGVRKSVASSIGMVILFVGIFVFIGVYFAFVSNILLESFHPLGLDSLYFSITTVLAVMLGVFGSVFNTYSTIYKAGDNELLLAMPIKPKMIVASKLIGVLLSGFMYELPVIIPALIVYWSKVGTPFPTVLLQLILLVVLGFLILSISCAFGYVVGAISNKFKNKAFISAIAMLLFLVLYYFVSMKLNKLLQIVTENAEQFGEKIKASTFLIYHMGNAFAGSFVSTLIFVALVLTLTVVVFLILNHSYYRIATSKAKEKTKKSKAVNNIKSPKYALFRKELKRFTTSSIYLLNCGIGVVIMLVGSVILAIKSESMIEILNEITAEAPLLRTVTPMLIVFLISLINSMNAVTAPSVSLEGKNLWMLQALPVDTKLILEAKVNLGVAINAIPSMLSAFILAIAFKLDVLSIILVLSITWLSVWVNSRVGLLIGLRFAMLNWVNESIPVKQSLSMFLTLLFGFLFSVLLVLPIALTIKLMSITVYMIILTVLLIVINILLDKIMNTKGVKLFDNL